MLLVLIQLPITRIGDYTFSNRCTYKFEGKKQGIVYIFLLQ